MIYWKALCLAGFAALACNAASAQTPAQNKLAQSKSAPALGSLPNISQEDITNTLDSLNLIKQGDASAQRLNWKEAQQEYQQALDLWPKSNTALYGLAKCSQAMGDTAKAIEYYRKAIYSTNPADKGFGETDTRKLMEFALLLNKTGQSAEAISVYNHGASMLDYEDSENHGGKPALKVLFPEIVMSDALPEQVPYTPEHLQALADILLAHTQQGFWSYKEIKAHAQEAAKLYPDSAPVQYYLGQALSGSRYAVLDSPAKDKAAAQAAYEEDKKGEVAAYQKAAEMGDEATAAEAKKWLAVPR